MKDINIKKVYVFTLISFVVTILFLYIFAQTGPHWYTGWDSHTSKNSLSIFADIMFIITLLVNCVGIILSIIYTCKWLFDNFGKHV
ncbi:MAG: hypothetical protein WCY46_03060 [Tissierellaceae bacterium]